jgi:sirohydrochlorin cobaltochelatase
VDDRCLILVAHGSRDPRWRAPFERLRDELRSELPVELAFLELAPPDFAQATAAAVAAGARRIRVLPLFMAGGAHVERELPALVDAARAAHPGVTFELLGAIGEHPRFVELLRELARATYTESE